MKISASALDPYKARMDALILGEIGRFGAKTPLRDACEYALMGSGKRFRPALVFMVSDALGYGADVSAAALAVEYFHTASLIADDLPSMDDDAERREKATTHIVFGESVAILATYSLISAGYECLVKNARDATQKGSPQQDLCSIAIEIASRCTGIHGASGGQFLDLTSENITLPLLQEIFYKKTGTLFELSFLLGWIFGGGNLELLPQVKKAAGHFGFAFQLMDDLSDLEKDSAKNQALNFAVILGKEKAIDLFNNEIDFFLEEIENLNIHSPQFEGLVNLLIEKMKKEYFSCLNKFPSRKEKKL